MKQNKTWKVYEHWTPNNMVYVGVTGQDIEKRWQPSDYKGTTLEPYINEFGWENITHQVIYTTPDREEAYQVEDEMYWYYKEKGVLINKRRSGLLEAKDKNAYMRQYRQDNPEAREKNKELCRQYRQNHKEERAACDRKYYKDHKEERNAYSRQYYQDHPEYREKQKERSRQLRLKKKAEKLLQSGQIEMPLAS